MLVNRADKGGAKASKSEPGYLAMTLVMRPRHMARACRATAGFFILLVYIWKASRAHVTKWCVNTPFDSPWSSWLWRSAVMWWAWEQAFYVVVYRKVPGSIPGGENTCVYISFFPFATISLMRDGCASRQDWKGPCMEQRIFWSAARNGRKIKSLPCMTMGRFSTFMK